MVRLQKLTRNFFLTVHGHNLHRQQQQQVSRALLAVRFSCLMRDRGASFQDGVAAGKSFCVFRFEVSRSVITVQREFRARFRKDTPCMVRLFQTVHGTQAAL